VIIVSGFIPYIVALKVVKTPLTTEEITSIPYSAVQTSTEPIVQTSVSIMTEQSVTTKTSQPFYISPQSVNCNNYAYSSAYLNSGTDTSVTYGASANLYMYVFDSAQYSAFSSSGTASPNEAEIDSQASGSTSFHISQSDMYYFVLFYKPQFFGCINAQPIGITSTSSSASYQTTVNYYVTTTNTQVSYSTVTTTATFYSASSYSTVLTNTSTKTCTVGWLQAAVSSC